jgi:hypothetical protein
MVLVGIVMINGAAAGCAGKAAVPPSSDLCGMTTAVDASQPLAERSLPASAWFALLLYGYQPTGAITRPATDCSSRRIDWIADRCSSGFGPATRLATQPVSPADLIVENLGDARRLVWAINDHFADGQAEGAVALAKFDAHGVRVEALGVLRAHPLRARLRLENVAGGTVLVAEGETCALPQDLSTCSRTARLVPLVGNRFVPVDLSSDTAGKCVSPSLLLLKSQGTIGKASGRKTYQFESSLTYSEDAVAVHEQLTVEERERDGTDGTFLRRVQGERRIRLQGGALLTTGSSILDLWMRAQP